MTTIKKLFHDAVPDYIIAIHRHIEHKGFAVFIVGGALRDLLMNRCPTEYDLATSATPHQIMALFDTVIPTGIDFGTVTIGYQGHMVEITTFRSESGYTDYRHPDQVAFVGTIDADLSRRDFTMNAMAYNPLSGDWIDPFDGQTHIQNRQLVCVGDPKKRLAEDTLRVFRAFRFMAQLGVVLDDPLCAALSEMTDAPLPNGDRMRHELNRLLLGPFWESGVHALHQWGWGKPFGLTWATPPSQLPQTLDYRWAWFISQCDWDRILQHLPFSHQHRRRFRHIIAWNFNPTAIEFTRNDVALSANDLQAMGFYGPALGQLQKAILHAIRSNQLTNSVEAIRAFVIKSRPTSED